MNQEKIGKFILSCRKKINLTQEELGEKLCVTSKAVSKWERGKSLPDASIMMPLCDILNISVNDLLSGEVVSNNNADENLITLQKQKEYAITSTKYTHIITIIILLIWNFINVFKYGVESAIDRPEFIVMNLITFVYFTIYVNLLNKTKN